MTKAELNALKAKALSHKDKANDMDVIVEAFAKLPYGQAKKVLTEEVLAVLAKYGYDGG